MASALARRIGRLETAKAPPRPLPHVVRVASGETKAEAYRRHCAMWPRIPKGHRFLVIPAREHDAEAFERDFYAQQTKLVAEARDERLRKGNDNEHYSRRDAEPGPAKRRICSVVETGNATDAVAWKPRQLVQR